MNGSYIELEFDTKQTLWDNFANRTDVFFVNLGPIATFSEFKLTTSSGKHLESNSYAHIVSLMYKLLSSKDGENVCWI